ncbi:MAG: hypothetical protein IKS83_06920 [Victivallales bacterium]|nr:hypothetical protein [Victivallales bacterium]
MVLPSWADYVITVRNGGQALFLHPVSVELTTEQLAFVQDGVCLTEDGGAAVEFAVDTTGKVPRLCWILDGETAPGRRRIFRLGSSVPVAKGSVLAAEGSVPAAKAASPSGELSCQVQGGFITIRNSYFQVRHPLRGNGGFPQDIQYRESGYTDSRIQFFDRLYHRELGLFWAKNDLEATCEALLNTPQRVVVESRVHFVADDGTPAPGNPLAVYQYVYSPSSPVVEVRRVITREDASQAWSEAHFLQTCHYDRFYTIIHCGEPSETTQTGEADAEPRSFSFSQWGIYATTQGAFGVGGTKGGGYDRGKHGFPYNLAAQNLGFPVGETERHQEALLYFGPARADVGWYSRWLGSARPTVTIQATEPLAETPEDIGEIILDCNGMKIYFAGAEEGFGCRGIEHLLGDQPVRFVFSQTTPTPLWNLAFKKPYAVRQQESDQPDFIDTVWLSSDSAKCPVLVAKDASEGLVFEWHGLDLPGEPGVVDVRCSVLAAKGSAHAAKGSALAAKGSVLAAEAASYWRIQVTNRSTQWGLAETQYPILAQVIHPGQGDALLPDHNWGHRLYRNSFRSVEQTYPTYKCPMQFMAFNQGDAGLYIAAHDPGARPKRLKVSSTQEVSFRVHAENASQPGSGNADDFAFCVAAYRGDWWQAAKRYRKWAISETPWTAKGPIATRPDYPRALVDASFWQRLNSHSKSTDVIASMMEELHSRIGRRPGFALHWYCWHQIPFDNSYPEYFPAKEKFAENVQRLTAQGMLMMPYINARLWDVDIPSFNDEVRAAAALPEHGEIAKETYGSGRYLTPMCPYTKLWQQKIAEICTTLMDECHVSGIYLDQIGCASPELCFNPSHGHPLGGGTHWVDGYRALLTPIKKMAASKGVFLTMEHSAEPYMDNIDGNLICSERFQEEVPSLAAVYSGYTIYFSSVNHPRDDLAAFRAGQCRDFLWGGQPGWNDEWMANDAHREHFAYDAYLGHLQQAAKEFFREGELLGEAKSTNDPGQVTVIWRHKAPHAATLRTVQGYWWKAPDGRLLLAIGNLSQEVGRIELQPTDLMALSGQNSRTAFLAERLTDTGTAPLCVVEGKFSHDFALEPGEVCLVTFTPADKKMLKNAQKRAETLAFDDKAAPELRNAAAEFLLRTEYGVTAFKVPEILHVIPGAPAEFSYYVFGKPDSKCQVVLPDGQCASVERGPLHTAQVRLDDTSASLIYCELRRGKLSWRMPVWCQTVNPVEITLGEVPEIRAGKSFLLEMTIQNFQAAPASGVVRLNFPESWAVEPSRIIHYEQLEVGRPKFVHVRVAVPEDAPVETASLTAEVIASRQSRPLAVQPARPQLTARRAAQPIDVQNPAAWPTNSGWAEVGERTPKCVKIADYRGNDDCSGRLRCFWDDQYLYVQAEVTDDAHVQKVAGEKLWNGDCVQIALRPDNANLTHGYDGLEREIGLALTENGFAFAYQWMGGPRQGILDNTPVSVKREGSQTHYCAAIPWSALLMATPSPGEIFFFSFTFNDNDDNGLRGWLEWTPGICGGKDSSLFGELHIIE